MKERAQIEQGGGNGHGIAANACLPILDQPIGKGLYDIGAQKRIPYENQEIVPKRIFVNKTSIVSIEPGATVKYALPIVGVLPKTQPAIKELDSWLGLF